MGQRRLAAISLARQRFGWRPRHSKSPRRHRAGVAPLCHARTPPTVGTLVFFSETTTPKRRQRHGRWLPRRGRRPRFAAVRGSERDAVRGGGGRRGELVRACSVGSRRRPARRAAGRPQRRFGHSQPPPRRPSKYGAPHLPLLRGHLQRGHAAFGRKVRALRRLRAEHRVHRGIFLRQLARVRRPAHRAVRGELRRVRGLVRAGQELRVPQSAQPAVFLFFHRTSALPRRVPLQGHHRPRHRRAPLRTRARNPRAQPRRLHPQAPPSFLGLRRQRNEAPVRTTNLRRNRLPLHRHDLPGPQPRCRRFSGRKQPRPLRLGLVCGYEVQGRTLAHQPTTTLARHHSVVLSCLRCCASVLFPHLVGQTKILSCVDKSSSCRVESSSPPLSLV
mmetsp:Transcript_14088/g.42611  ORF Transcript_14088/g.42611 Transcript_14088/m.42611 type:complete len:389 (-) Transcript_14088:112-1278(-)